MLTGCGSDDPATIGSGDGLDPSGTEVVLRFTDSSVPPEHHRSYVLTADGSDVHVVVDSYGDVLHDVTEPLSEQVCDDVVSDLSTAEVDDDHGEGCVGGTSTRLTVTEGSETRVDVTIAACGGGDDDDALERIADLTAPLAEIVDLRSLRRT
jgi:hypothetical protein